MSDVAVTVDVCWREMSSGGTPGAIISQGGVLRRAPSPKSSVRLRSSARQRRTLAGSLASTAVVLVLGAAIVALPAAPARHAVTARHGLASLPTAAQGPISAALGRDEPAYRVLHLRAANPAQHLRAAFSPGGVTVASGKARLGIALSAYGYASALRPLRPAEPRVSGNRVSYARGAVTEWYTNGPLGLEQGFDVAARPVASDGPLTFSLTLRGNLASRMQGGSVLLEGHGAALRYGGLLATDAHGRPLRAWLQLASRRVLIRIDARGAAYPLRIDPFIQQGSKLTPSDESGKGAFGGSVALSADGRTAVIGGSTDNSEAGAAWVFTRSGSTWNQQAKLTGSEELGGSLFGTSVALSSDGNTALIGGFGDNGHVGAAWGFTRSGSTWTQQGSKLTGGEELGNGGFGISVALSSDGNTALIGGSRDNAEAGAIWVFTRGLIWTQQGPKLTGSGEINPPSGGGFGQSVALSADGNTALVGGYKDNNFIGAAWVFTRSGTTWTQQGAKLTGGSEATVHGAFGVSVALAADGNTALIGAWEDNGFLGAVWVFTRSGATWTQLGAKLTGAEETGAGFFGTSVALSAAGDTALIGGFSDNGGVGAAWAFARSGSTWTQQGSKLTGSEEVGKAQFGSDVALSSDGYTALVGGSAENTFVGAAWVFANPPPVVLPGAPPTTTKTPPVALAPPQITSASESHRSWREGRALARLSRRQKLAPLGTTISLTLSEQASVSFAFNQQVGGRKVNGKCVAQTSKNRRKHPCKRTLTRGTLAFAGQAGANKLSFQGRISTSKKLGLGGYTLVLTAANAAGRSASRSLSFTIVK
jgi:hypothetical protein